MENALENMWKNAFQNYEKIEKCEKVHFKGSFL